jgi:Tol biopolymer transport system component
VLAILGVVLMVLLLLSFMADSQRPATSDVAAAQSNRVAYMQFGIDADTLRLADPSDPSTADTLLTIPHAAEYGILPRMSPDHTRFAYTALPAGVPSPGPDSPAELWVATMTNDAPSRLADGLDLLVPPMWTPDGSSLVYRRSTNGNQTLAMMDSNGGEERIVAYSETEALFPVGFVSDSGELLYVGLNDSDGSHLYRVELATGVATQIGTLSPGLTREWSLSPDGTRLAYLDIAFSETQIASQAYAMEVATGTTTPITSNDEVAFGPIWSDAGQLAIGTFNEATQDAALLIVDGDSRSTVAGPASGFDVPLAYSPAAGAYLVSSFENDSITSPGRSTLTLVKADGTRETIAEGEVTLVGWTHP